MWIEAGMLVDLDPVTATIAFPTDQSLALEYCEQANNRKFLEEVASRLTKRVLKLKFIKREGLVVTAIPVVEKKPEFAGDPMEVFKNDPLIRKALEMFKAELQPG